MTEEISSLSDIASNYDAIVLDQWGVLHDGSAPYRSAVTALEALTRSGVRLAVLSNSGKRSLPNAERIAGLGFQNVSFEQVMTSGEALWRDIAQGRVPERRFWAIERAEGDASRWAEGLDISLVASADQAEAVLLMGLPDGSTLENWQWALNDAISEQLPMYCSNPDRNSPRADGLVISPGALAYAYRGMGGQITFYGKPHLPIFTALETPLGTKRLLMVGDSVEHDIGGAETAGWDTLLIEGGIYADKFAQSPADEVLARITAEKGVSPPTYRIKELA